MKFNWGHGIILILVVAISGYMILVYITTRQRVDMVTEDYYPKELKYEDQINKSKNYNALSQKVQVEIDQQLIIRFPKEAGSADEITGVIHFYRPSDKLLDIEKPIDLDNAFSMAFPKADFSAGKYELIIEWQVGETAYLTKQDIFID